jgi:hypothetical protein
MQLFRLHPSIYKWNYYVCPEDNLPSEAATIKLKLEHCANLKKRKVPWEQIKAIVGTSRSNYFRLKKLAKTLGFKGLMQRSKRPRKVRTSLMPQAHIDLILKIRKDNPTYGKAKLAAIIKT